MVDRKFNRIVYGGISTDLSKGRVKSRVICLMDNPDKEIWSKYYDL